jgi:hypothetical protein
MDHTEEKIEGMAAESSVNSCVNTAVSIAGVERGGDVANI